MNARENDARSKDVCMLNNICSFFCYYFMSFLTIVDMIKRANNILLFQTKRNKQSKYKQTNKKHHQQQQQQQQKKITKNERYINVPSFR